MNEQPIPASPWEAAGGYGGPADNSDVPLRQAADAMKGETLRAVVVVTNPQGLHLRPAAAFAERARASRSDVAVEFNGRRVDGKSVWDLLLLAALQGSELTLEVTGPDAAEALPALAELLAAPGDGGGGDSPPP